MSRISWVRRPCQMLRPPAAPLPFSPVTLRAHPSHRGRPSRLDGEEAAALVDDAGWRCGVIARARGTVVAERRGPLYRGGGRQSPDDRGGRVAERLELGAQCNEANRRGPPWPGTGSCLHAGAGQERVGLSAGHLDGDEVDEARGLVVVTMDHVETLRKVSASPRPDPRSAGGTPCRDGSGPRRRRRVRRSPPP